MPATFAQVNEVNPGESITAEIFNALLRSHNNLVSVSGSVIGSLQPGNLRLNFKRSTDLVRDIAIIGLVQAEETGGSVKLDAFKPAGIVEATFDADVVESSRRITICKPAESEHFGKWVIPIQDIDPGFLGPAIIEGLALVKFKRLFNKMVLNRVDIWGSEDVLVENIIGLGEWIHDEGKAIGVEQFALIRMSARPDGVFRIQSTAAQTVGNAVMISSGGLVGDGIPQVKKPDEDYTGHALIVVGKNITAGETGFASAGLSLAQVDDVGDPDDDFGGEDDKSTLIKCETGFRSLGKPGSTGGAAYIIARPFCAHLIRADAVNMLDDQNADTVNADDGTLEENFQTGASKLVAVHFKRGTFRLIGSPVQFTAQPRFDALFALFEDYLNSELTVKAQYIVDDYDPTTATFNSINALTKRGSFSAFAEHDSGGVDLSSGNQIPVHIDLDLINGFFSIWHGRDGFKLSQADIDAGRKIHGILLELLPSTNYSKGLAVATVQVPADFKDVEHVLDVGSDQ